MGTNISLNRVHVQPDHTLVIQNITKNDTAIYFCHGIFGQEMQFKYNYLIDPVMNTSVSPLVGNLNDWKEYHENYLMPLNGLIQVLMSPTFAVLYNPIRVQLKARTEWEIWGPCVACNRPQGERRRVGKCRLKVSAPKFKNVSIYKSDKHTQEILRGISQLSCQSYLVAELFPKISMVTRMVPQFIHVEYCVGFCKPGALHDTSEEVLPLMKRENLVLIKGSQTTLVCPKARAQTVVTWLKNGVMINPEIGQHDSDSARVVVDVFGSLILRRVTHKEEGNYTCYINNVKIKETIVWVFSQSQLISAESLRHMAYLGLIFALLFVCYCGGVAIACSKRHTFVLH
ncbi:uncharacterized protein [Anabrus simplex]|uniref:uncharacterized protein n=1 Tax=Anabrus simplex TaxID=316456 RepID=UPI0034DCE434